MALILVICQKIGQMGLTLATLTKSAFFEGGANARHGFYQGQGGKHSIPNCKGQAAVMEKLSLASKQSRSSRRMFFAQGDSYRVRTHALRPNCLF